MSLAIDGNVNVESPGVSLAIDSDVNEASPVDAGRRCDVDESKPSRCWPATRGQPKRVFGPSKEFADHEKSLWTIRRVHWTINREWQGYFSQHFLYGLGHLSMLSSPQEWIIMIYIRQLKSTEDYKSNESMDYKSTVFGL